MTTYTSLPLPLLNIIVVCLFFYPLQVSLALEPETPISIRPVQATIDILASQLSGKLEKPLEVDVGQLRCGSRNKLNLKIANDLVVPLSLTSIAVSCQCTGIAFEPCHIAVGKSEAFMLVWDAPHWSSRARVELLVRGENGYIGKVSLYASVVDYLKIPDKGPVFNIGKVDASELPKEYDFPLYRGGYKADWDLVRAISDSGNVKTNISERPEGFSMQATLSQGGSRQVLGWSSFPITLEFYNKGKKLEDTMSFRLTALITSPNQYTMSPSSLYYGIVNNADAEIPIKTCSLTGVSNVRKIQIESVGDDRIISLEEPILEASVQRDARDRPATLTVRRNPSLSAKTLDALRAKSYNSMMSRVVMTCTFDDASEGEVGLPVYFTLPHP